MSRLVKLIIITKLHNLSHHGRADCRRQRGASHTRHLAMRTCRFRSARRRW